MSIDPYVYLDNNASTPVDSRVLEAMLDALSRAGNPSSSHLAGARAAALVRLARERVAGLLNAAPADVVFTGGATEANNIVLKGLAADGGRRRVVTCVTEHPSVLVPAAGLRSAGFDVRLVPVRPDGVIDLAEFESAVGDDTLLVSVMAANNETGVLAPLAEVTAIAHDRGALVHTDATQLMAWGGLDTVAVPVDLVSLSAHKFHGPQGTGALLVRAAARPRLRALLEGGGQESGLRSGTLNVAGIVGTGMAAALAATEGRAAAPAVAARRDRLHTILAGADGTVVLIGATAARAAGTLSVSVPGVDLEVLAARTPDVLFSAGSACKASTAKPSHVLSAMGLTAEHASRTMRLSLSRLTTDAEVERAGAALRAAIEQLRT